jgi:hypothetical protein
MAPEQYRSPDAVDHRADIFSLGVVFYEMLTGELPLGSFPLPSSKVGVDVRLDGIVMRALERERDRRWQKVSEVKTHVSEIAASDAAAAAVAAAGAAAAGAGPTSAAVPADAAAPPAAADAPAPPAERQLSRLAVAGGLGLPAAFVAAVVGWILVRPFATGHAAAWTAALFFSLTALAGWVASLVGWAHFDPARQRGRGWAIAGSIVPLVLFCSGGFVLPLWVVSGSPTRSPVGIHDGPEGTWPEFGGFSVEDSPGRTKVKLPGIVVEETPEGRKVTLPGITVTDPKSPQVAAASKVDTAGTMTPDARVAHVNSIEELWSETVLTFGMHFDSDRLKLFPAEEKDRYEKMSLSERTRRDEERMLGIPFIDADADLRSEPREYRLFAVHIDNLGPQTVGRAVRTDGKETISFPIQAVDGKWRCSIGEVEIEDRAPGAGDRDGWLRR